LHRLPGNESLDLIVRDWRIPVRGLPEGLGGLNIVHLTDWHMSPRYDRRFFEHAVDEANRLDPDLVLFTGDLVEDESAIEWVEPILGRLSARVGKLAILGNHDLLYGPDAIMRAVESAGFEDVDGRWSIREAGGRTIALGGTSAPWGPRLDPSFRPGADLTVVLSHSPDQFYQIASWGSVDLVLAGHNHGGQVRLPVFGPVLMPSLYSRRFDRGFFLRGRTWMYVSQGLGAKHPIRYNCRPELTRIVLQSEPVLVAHHTTRRTRHRVRLDHKTSSRL
jgi:predicted MPP superfamily phosphohydrolase